MDSYDNDLMFLMFLDDDLFFVDIREDEQEHKDVEKVSEQSDRA